MIEAVHTRAHRDRSIHTRSSTITENRGRSENPGRPSRPKGLRGTDEYSD